MDATTIKFDPAAAAQLVRKYKEHRAWATPVDEEIARLATMIAKGKIIIRAQESIRQSPRDDYGRPRLALARADAKYCVLHMQTDGSAIMHDHHRNDWLPPRMAASRQFKFAKGTFGTRSGQIRCEAMVPLIPLDIRPKRGLQNYHILFEAEWSRNVPVDPMLLRRVGKDGDTWIVLQAWELTDIERAVLAGHLKQ